MDLKIQEKQDGITIECHITPKASKSAIKGVRNGELTIAVNSPPTEGQANEALINFLAKHFSIPKSYISIIKGLHSRKKILHIKELSKNQLLVQLTRYL